MYQLINLQINKQVLPLFSFLKDNPTRTIAKDNHVMMTYYQPPDFYIVPFSYKGITVTVTDTDDLESYLADGWQVARDYQVASVQDKLAGILDELEHEYLNRQRAGSPLAINGVVYHWIAYGLSSKEEIIAFVKLFYLNGYSYEQITQLYASLTKSNKFNICFLNTINTIFKEELNERLYESA
ncbi:phage protein [Streptococcus gallolyticus]|uniref:Phage protein n=1 Tax=Streptococcus gallolyticus TaxID=315405 RepID=A0AA94M532_9STRE|nr:hypothetical protein [Streptococcus gallolyticus]AQP43383.1 hypothetical protein BTR42_12090 [Streptococcus gallolyticus subsp. gallolyticus DSM 16831]SQG80681.1 phage protein [Streptococcus gallolyticus]